MRHDLLGYLLGALDGCEHETIREQLTVDADLRQQLVELQQRLTVLERQRVHYEPPGHLCESTCRLIAKHIGEKRLEESRGAAGVSAVMIDRSASTQGTDVLRSENDVLGGRIAALMSPVDERCRSSREWSFIDMGIAAGIFLAAAFLFLPSLLSGRNLSVALQCQENLRNIASGAVSYSSMHGALPTPVDNGMGTNAGMIPATLAENGFIQVKWLVCPASQYTRSASRSVPFDGEPITDPQLTTADAVKIASLLNSGYCYPIGHVTKGIYVPRRPTGSPYLAFLSDLPCATPNGPISSHHAQRRINVVFDDLSIRELSEDIVENPAVGHTDHLFFNDQGEVAPGLHPADSVMVPGMRRPDFSGVKVQLRMPVNAEPTTGNVPTYDVLIESNGP